MLERAAYLRFYFTVRVQRFPLAAESPGVQLTSGTSHAAATAGACSRNAAGGGRGVWSAATLSDQTIPRHWTSRGRRDEKRRGSARKTAAPGALRKPRAWRRPDTGCGHRPDKHDRPTDKQTTDDRPTDKQTAGDKITGGGRIISG